MFAVVAQSDFCLVLFWLFCVLAVFYIYYSLHFFFCERGFNVPSKCRHLIGVNLINSHTSLSSWLSQLGNLKFSNFCVASQLTSRLHQILEFPNKQHEMLKKSSTVFIFSDDDAPRRGKWDQADFDIFTEKWKFHSDISMNHRENTVDCFSRIPTRIRAEFEWKKLKSHRCLQNPPLTQNIIQLSPRRSCFCNFSSLAGLTLLCCYWN